MKVLLINLVSNLRFPALGCAYILSHLKENSVDVDFFDLLSEGIRLEHKGQKKEKKSESILKFAKAVASTSRIIKPIKESLKKVKSLYDSKKSSAVSSEALKKLIPMVQRSDYDFILISTAYSYNECRNITRELIRVTNTPIIVGGPLFSIPGIAKSWLGSGGIDFIAAFEAEQFLYELLTKYHTDEVDSVKGIWRLKNGKIHHTGKADLVQNIDDVAFPSFDEYDPAKYKTGVLPILPSRGCAWGRCTFCTDPCVVTNDKQHRKRSPENVIAELKGNIEKHGIKRYIFLEEGINGDIVWWQKLLHAIIDSGIGINFIGAFQSTKHVTKEMLKLSYDAGYRVIAPGIESGSNRMLKLMKKGTSVRMNEALIRSANDVGINVRCSIMYSFLGETPQDLKETIEFLKRNQGYIKKVWLSKFSITIGSPVYHDLAKYEKEGLVKDLKYDFIKGQVYFKNPVFDDKEYVKRFYELQNLTNEINQTSYQGEAAAFDQIL